jgi:alpha-glucosidase
MGEAWWHKGIIYQIYPRSFADQSGDGVGDLRGVMGHLDYLAQLGVDAVWLSPIYPSPMADFGYDISNYVDVHPLFGTLDDFDDLLREIHHRGMKLILDFVPNHTSDQHPWFAEAKSSRTSPKRDWYIWRDPAPGGGPPNNWLSNFGGSAWKWDAHTEQYYYHAFLDTQPDLNWRNPELRHAMHNVLRFWSRRGVDGFRVDVIWHLAKDDQFRDNPRNPHFIAGQNPHWEFVSTYEADRPQVHDEIAGMRKVIDEFPDRVLIGEIYLSVERMMAYYGKNGAGVHMPFNFQLITMPWGAARVADAVAKYEAALPDYGWPNWVLGNHDNSRIATRVGNEQARVAAMLLLTLRGTPTLYYGDEIGMRDVKIPAALVQDPFEKNVPGLGLGRDPERTPMQWSAAPNAGFTREGVTPWLPLAEDFAHVNVASEERDPTSMLSFYEKMIALRRAELALATGGYRHVTQVDDVFAYARVDPKSGRELVIALNFGAQPHALPVRTGGRVLLSTTVARTNQLAGSTLSLAANEGVIVGYDAPR